MDFFRHNDALVLPIVRLGGKTRIGIAGAVKSTHG